MVELGEERLTRLRMEAEQIITGQGMEMVDLEFKREGREHVLRLFIDKKGGIGVDDCASISRHVEMMLDVEGFISGPYHLEVSSPGINRPLKRPADYRRFEGRLARIRMVPETPGRKKFRGRLAGVDGDEVLLRDEREGRTHRLPLKQIRSARLEMETRSERGSHV